MYKTRVFPTPRLTQRTITPLSILDASVARFSAARATFLFDALSQQSGPKEGELLEKLLTSFTSTLASFPQWAGQLKWAPVQRGGKHTDRFHRPMVVYGSDDDPGVEWSVVRHSYSLHSIVPPESTWTSGGTWIADNFPQDALHSSTHLALYNLRDYEGLPAMQVQINIFSDRGYGISVKLAHALADAQSLVVFVHHWAAACRALFGHPSPSLAGPPVFNPAELDDRATGDIDASTPDPNIMATALGLPVLRYDWWETSAPGYPDLMLTNTENSRPTDPDLVAEAMKAPVDSGPWDTWDLSRPASNVVLHFTPSDLDRLRNKAREDLPDDTKQTVSRLDALQVHLWQRVSRARGLQASAERVFLDVTLGARTRVSPALSESFLGSPLFLTNISTTGTELSANPVGVIAARLRKTMEVFTPENMGALLHSLAHEVAPQRLWQGFMGSRHLLTTSWLRLRTYEIDFLGQGVGPRYVHACMSKVDGFLVVMEAPDGGIDVGLYLDKEVMCVFLKNEGAAKCE